MNYFTLCLIVLLSFSLASLAQLNEGVLMRGKIIYGAEKAICVMNLQNIGEEITDIKSKKRVEKLYEGEAEFSHFSKIDNNRFLFEQWDDNGRLIREFNRKTKRVQTLRKGEFPVYMPKYHQFLFWDDGLKIANIGDPIRTVTKIAEGGTSDREIVPISDDEVVFVRENAKSTIEGHHAMGIWRYNLSTNALKKLPLDFCGAPAVWVDSSKKLFCRGDRNHAGYLLTNLQGHIDNRWAFGEGDYPVLYIPEINKLLVSRTVLEDFSEVSHLWIYDLSTDKKRMISKYNGFALGDGIYYPD